MENLLSQGLKNIIVFVLAVIALVGGAVISYFLFFNPPQLDKKNIEKFILKRINVIEKKLEQRNRDYQKRSEGIFHGYQSKSLQHRRLNQNEALIIEEKGVIKDYFGEIYHFKFPPLETGAWGFIEKSNHIYFIQKMADRVFYVRYFCHLENNRLLTSTSFAVSEIKYSKSPLLALENKYIYDNMNDVVSYYHLLRHANGQFILHLKFSKEDIKNYYKKNEKIFFYSVIGLFLLLSILYFYKQKLILSQISWLAFLVDLFFFLSLLGESNLYLKPGLMGITLNFHSLYQVLVILLFLLSILHFVKGQIKTPILSYIFFNVFLIFIVKVCDSIFKGVQFNYLDFSLDHLALIVVTFLLHLYPLFFIGRGVCEFFKELKTLRQKIVKGGIFLLVQMLVILFIYLLFKSALLNILILSLIAFMLIFMKKSFLLRAAIIFLLAISIYHLMADFSLREKKEFIENNLKNIFLNQSNYALFIAREIVHEINLSSDLYEFFQGDTSSKLESIWRRTIASRENIASGIFVVSREDEVLSYFSYQIPFFKVKTRNIFPFWAMENTTAEVYGREIPLAAAYISIFKEWENLGRIFVLVYNSPELLLRYQDKVNIFTIDSKIDGSDFSYIKLNNANQIVENPSNINLENITGILKQSSQWTQFKAMDMLFKGYIFRHNGNAFIIFFPGNTFFKYLSEVIKIFLLLSFLVLLFYVKDLKKIEWRSVYYSFSIRVFTILILISLLTAIVFSVFFINFSTRTSEQKVMRMVYESGRTAQNIAYDLLGDSSEFSQDLLFSMSNILNGDVSIYYENGNLVDSSNFRKIINSQIPTYLHSNILTLLNEKNQKFVLLENKKSFHLFYKIYDYIFMVELSNKWEKSLFEERYYSDFIITLFFILIVIGFAAAFFFRNKIISPIDGLNKGMAEVERGNLYKLEQVPSEIEIKNLYMGFNSMIEGIRDQKRNISEMSRMKTIIRLGRRVAHEVKNPLTPIKLSAEQILKALNDKNPNFEEIIKQSINYIIDETEHLKRVSYGFLDLSRLDEINAEEFDLVDLIREELFNVTQIYSHIDFSFFAESGKREVKTMKVTLDKIKIKQVLKNLITNSIEAIGEKKGEIRINLGKNVGDKRVTIEVVDSGGGMDKKKIERAFEVDYSTKDIGTGLGLFIVKRIVELHKGSIEIISEENKGTQVILDLPLEV